MPSRFSRFSAITYVLTLLSVFSAQQGLMAQSSTEYEYLLLATNKTSTMQEEMQEAAEAGYAFVGVMGGETSFGGSEVVIVMERLSDSMPRFEYRLLANSKTCTAPGFLDTRLRYAAWRSSYSSRASLGVRYASFSRRQHWL